MRPLPAYHIEAPDVISIECSSRVRSPTGGVTGQYLVVRTERSISAVWTVGVTGMTVAEARTAIQKQLAAHLESPEVAVDVVAYNSKVYYVITQGAGLGDSVRRLPSHRQRDGFGCHPPNQRAFPGLQQQNIWIVRPLASDPQKPAILTVDWDGISAAGRPPPTTRSSLAIGSTSARTR